MIYKSILIALMMQKSQVLAQLDIPETIIYVKEGANQRIRCNIPGSKKLLRVSTEEQILFVKIKGSKTTQVGSGSEAWSLVDDSIDDFSINLELISMSPEKALLVSCDNDSGDTIKYDIRLQKEPLLTFTEESTYPLSENSLLQMSCSAEDSVPKPQIRWEFSNGRTFNTSISQLSSESLKSTMSAKVTRQDNGVGVQCVVVQNNESVKTKDFGILDVQFKPAKSDIVFSTKPSLVHGEKLTAQCTVSSNPPADISYEIALKTSEIWQPLDVNEPFSYELHDQAKVRCVASVGEYRVESNFDMISVFTKQTTTTPTTTTTTRRTTAARPSSSTIGEKVKNSELTTGAGTTSADSETETANLEVEKAGPRGIILSIIGVSCFLGFVIFLFFIRRCLQDRQGDSYKTEETNPDEAVSLHDPELEAHKKKEYFM
ncbi:unnamed protein product [Oikopleura dioica]|uniref:Ig-like domain-containing protein n=1 Tax=Oikopleura dioica TaxID=34765 RepID=E4YLA3_OIKDI|nr:unnamed protein product [Oikopleura dioica]